MDLRNENTRHVDGSSAPVGDNAQVVRLLDYAVLAA